MPTRTPDAVEDQIVGLRRVQRCGPDGIGAELGATTRTVSRVLRRRGVRYQKRTSGRAGARGRQMVGRIPDCGGWRAHGYTDVPDRKRKQSNGFDYVHSVVHDPAGIFRFRALAVEKGTICAPFLHCAAGYFRDHGITHIERVMTDSAWAYRLPIAPSVRRAGRPPGVHQTALQLAETER